MKTTSITLPPFEDYPHQYKCFNKNTRIGLNKILYVLEKGANQCITRGQIIAPLKNRGIFNEGAIQWGANQCTPTYIALNSYAHARILGRCKPCFQETYRAGVRK